MRRTLFLFTLCTFCTQFSFSSTTAGQQAIQQPSPSSEVVKDAQGKQQRPMRRPRGGRRTIIAPPPQTATYDTDSSHVNAHGGCIIQHAGQWLWYGESRPWRGFTSEGVRLYTSPAEEPHEGMAWQNRGLVLAVTDSVGSPIERGCIIERPKVLWNERTQQFVMIFHLELKGQGYAAALTGFATSSTPEGPFIFHHAQRPNAGLWPTDFTAEDIANAKGLKESNYPEWWTPAWREAVRDGLFLARDLEQGQMSRDMTVFVDADSTAWHIYASEENLTLQAAELTPDYLGYTGRYYRIAAGGQNEAPVIFKHDGLYWLICSGCTGWEPNEARMFSAPAIQGPWTQHPSPMQGPQAEKTFGAQGTWAWSATVNGQPQLFFMADIWYPRSLAQSRHLCLPIRFDESGKPIISSPFQAPQN